MPGILRPRTVQRVTSPAFPANADASALIRRRALIWTAPDTGQFVRPGRDWFGSVGTRTGSRFIYRSKVFVKDRRESFAVGLPVSRGGIVFQAGDPVAVEFVDCGIDSIPFQPAFTQGAGIAKSFARAAFSEPGE